MGNDRVSLKRRLIRVAAAVALLLAAPSPGVGATRASQTPAARSPDSRAQGEARVAVPRVRKGLDGVLVVLVRKLEPRTTYEIVVQGVRIGTLTTNGAGRGRARFRTHPRRGDQLLGVDPRGKRVAVHALTGLDSLKGIVPGREGNAGDHIRCCVPGGGDQTPECDTVSANECNDKGGSSMGGGSCMPNPCPPPPPPPG